MSTSDAWWPAPSANAPVHGVVSVPGSKSATNRALILAALADGPSTITGALDARDTRLMVQALRSLGVPIDSIPAEQAGNVDLQVRPRPLHGPARIDVGLAGTVMRFVPPIAVLAEGAIEFDGDAGARQRPMRTTLASLRDLGADIAPDAVGLPFTVLGHGHLRGGSVTIDASTSSQFVSALLLAGARYDDGIRIRHVGPPVPSQPHIEMTLAMLAEHGVAVDASVPDLWSIGPGHIAALDRHIEPDLSNAAPFLAAAMVTQGSVTVLDWPGHSTQPGDMLRGILARMGATVELGEQGLTVSMPGDLTGIDADLSDVGELTPTLAALAALARTPSRFHGIAHLRGHETDRLAALVREINSLGGNAEETSDGLRITPAALHGGRFHTYADHRMATAGAIIGLRVPGVEVEDIETTSKTLPDFVDRWTALVSA